jgi:rhodanese-related sulfurtransferase
VDVRPIGASKNEIIEGALQIPADDIVTAPGVAVDRLKPYKMAYLLCQDGQFARKAYDALAKAGARNVMFVAVGGFNEWVNKRYPHISKELAKKQENVEEWILDQERMEKKAWALNLPTEQATELLEKIKPLRVLDMKGSYVIWNPTDRKALLLFPKEDLQELYYDQVVRRGFFLEAIVGQGASAETLATKFFGRFVPLNQESRSTFLERECEVASTDAEVHFSGVTWKPGSVTTTQSL